MSPCRHAPDKNVAVAGMLLHPETVAQHGAASKRTRWIDGDDADGAVRRAKFAEEAINQRAFPGTWWSGYASEIGAAGVPEDLGDQVSSCRIVVFHLSNRARDAARIAREHALGQRRGHLARSCRAITSRWISLVPSPMVVSFTSRKYFSAG